jgi:hypothetical protein
VQNTPIIGEYPGQYFILLICFAADILSCCYLYGYMFQKSNTAYKAFGIFNYFFLYFLPYAIVQLLFLNDKPQFSLTIVKVIAYALSPFYAFLEALFTYAPAEGPFSADAKIGGCLLSDWYYYAIFFLCQAVLFMIFTIYLESRKYNLNIQQAPAQMLAFDDSVPIDTN